MPDLKITKRVDAATPDNINSALEALKTATKNALDVLDVLSTAGDIFYFDGTDYQRLAIGTAGQPLVVNSGATAPSWATLGIGGGGTGQTTATAAFDALAPTTTQGDTIYHNGTDNVRLAKGTARQVLQMNAGATAPEWTGDLALASLKVGTGTDDLAIAAIAYETVTWNPGSIAAGGVATTTAAVDSSVDCRAMPFVVGVPTAWSGSIIYSARGTGTDTVTIYAHNPTAGAIDPGASGSVRVIGFLW